MSKLEATPRWQKVGYATNAVGVDRENAILFGMVVCQCGPVKDGRGEFDVKGLQTLIQLGNRQPLGLKSRFGHPTLSDDGLGKYLGRVRNLRMDAVQVQRDGRLVRIEAIRGDLHFDETSLREMPGGGKPLGEYVLDRAESDPDSLSSSIVMASTREEQLDPRTGRIKTDAKGRPVPPLWRPTALHASDVVCEGAAVDGILSAGVNVDGLPDHIVRQACSMLDQQFGNASRDVIRARAVAWLDRYLSMRFGTSSVSRSDGFGNHVKAVMRDLRKDEAAEMKRRIRAVEGA
jgi:hypothetical protein